MTCAGAIGESIDAPARQGNAAPDAAGPGAPVLRLRSGGIGWQLQRAGTGPALLLLHGTGSSGRSWSRVAQLLAQRFDVIAPDLPGHGGTAMLPAGRARLEDFAAAIRTLSTDLRIEPPLIVGHSAGAAIAARVALDIAGRASPRVLSLNGALRPLAGWTAMAFVPVARLLGLNPWVPPLVSWRAGTDPHAVRCLLDSTGSRIDAGMLDHYQGLLRSRGHVAGTLRMLSQWDLRPLARDLPRLGARLTLAVGASDRTVSPRQAEWVRSQVTGCRCVELAGLGHLAHEEAPQAVAGLIESVAAGALAMADTG